MAISTNDSILKFGTQDAVTTTGGSTADGAFSNAGQWTNDDDSPYAAFVFTAQWATATSIAGKLINLYTVLHNINSTNDASDPTSTHRHIYLGSFVAPASTNATTYYMPLAQGTVLLPAVYSSQVHEFFLENRTGQTFASAVNYSLHVTPVAYGPAA